jgi:DNA-binding LacI/PurR family transcriptional regulator
MTRSDTPISDDIRAQIGATTGVIFLGLSPAPETLNDFAEAGIAAVVANGVDEELKLDSVSPTNFLGGIILAKYLTDLGHRRVLYFRGLDRSTLLRRFAGSRQHIEGRDDWPDAKVVSSFKRDLSGSEEADRVRFNAWITRYKDDATALLCFNDGAAVWAIEAMRALGMSVPDDMSVVGFDDMPVARLTNPSLTTFSINWDEIGRESVQILHKRFSFPHAEIKMVQIGGHMIVRDSAQAL